MLTVAQQLKPTWPTRRQAYGPGRHSWLRRMRETEFAYLDKSARELKQAAQQCFESEDRASRIRMGGLYAAAVRRTLGFHLHDEQLLAMACGTGGSILEMSTGEGKTVVTAGIAAMVCGPNRSVHISTTNAYLAERDAKENVPVFEQLGLDVSVLPATDAGERASQNAYRSAIVYGPGYQYGFDYLRDQTKLRLEKRNHFGGDTEKRIRGWPLGVDLIQPQEHYVALIDEADSVMIDEATTPLILSLPTTESDMPEPYRIARQVASTLVEATDFTIDRAKKQIRLTAAGEQKAHAATGDRGNLTLMRPWRVYISNALRSHFLMRRNEDYVVRDGKVQIVDPYTGRIFADRTWQDGLHQAVEAKEHVDIQPGRESSCQITRQRFLGLYKACCGLTGTATQVADEFRKVYRCRVTTIPTHRKCKRRVAPVRFFRDKESKLAAIATSVRERHQTGQPILIGTSSIQESLQVEETLQKHGLRSTLLNGLQDQEEAEIVAQAGRSGRITIATNMAGRGTDIKPDERAIESGGLHVIGVSPNTSYRIDRQLIGRAARQGQPGSAQIFSSAEDSIYETSKTNLGQRIARSSRRSSETWGFDAALRKLQAYNEQQGFRARQSMMTRDRWMDSVRSSIEKD